MLVVVDEPAAGRRRRRRHARHARRGRRGRAGLRCTGRDANRTDATGPAYPASRQFIQSEQPDTRNHEIRISTPLKGRFTAQAGYFYFTERNLIDSGVFNLAMNPGIPIDFSNTYGIKFDYVIRTKTQGLFSQVGWSVTPDLKLTVGARYSRDEKERIGQSRLLLGALVSPFIPVPAFTVPGDGHVKESKPTWQV
ncbi:MAG: TonB-dependent receptor domain-containing protein, partial [Kineosporiaceae bacterium]